MSKLPALTTQEHMASPATIVEDLAEKTPIPRTRSLDFYAVLVLVVLPVWSVVPLSWAFVAYTLLSSKFLTFGWTGFGVFAGAACEVSTISL